MLPRANATRFRADAIALMYHAVVGGKAAGGPDPHYSLPLAVLRRQLDEIGCRAGGATSVRDWLSSARPESVLLTFDDGHASDRRLAMPLLLERGMRADFFINPANVGRAGFASWPELREMAAAGMSIQSHGYEHRYFTELAPGQLRESLRAARLEIEVRIGSPVFLLAPPGGRMPRGFAEIARGCGYTHVLSSQPGWLRHEKDACVLPRVAVTAEVGEREFCRWLDGRRASILRQVVRYRALAIAKSVLGDARYERARERALAFRENRA